MPAKSAMTPNMQTASFSSSASQHPHRHLPYTAKTRWIRFQGLLAFPSTTLSPRHIMRNFSHLTLGPQNRIQRVFTVVEMEFPARLRKLAPSQARGTEGGTTITMPSSLTKIAKKTSRSDLPLTARQTADHASYTTRSDPESCPSRY